MNRYLLPAFKKEPLPEITVGSRWRQTSIPDNQLLVESINGKDLYIWSNQCGNATTTVENLYLHFEPWHE